MRAQHSDYVWPQIPDSIEDFANRADYATCHFWDDYNFRDTTLLRPDFAEQALTEFLSLLPYATPAGRTAAIAHWLGGMQQSLGAVDYFTAFAEHYLYDPDSPLLNDTLYLEVLNHLLVCDSLGEERRERWCLQRQTLLSNGVGTMASDFSYQTSDGDICTLKDSKQCSPLLLLFYDPQCDHCREVMKRLRQSDVLSRVVQERRLRVMAVCIETDENQWKQSLCELAPNWTAVADRSDVAANALYDLRLLPGIFVIDEEHRVVLRNATLQQLLTYLTADAMLARQRRSESTQ